MEQLGLGEIEFSSMTHTMRVGRVGHSLIRALLENLVENRARNGVNKLSQCYFIAELLHNLCEEYPPSQENGIVVMYFNFAYHYECCE